MPIESRTSRVLGGFAGVAVLVGAVLIGVAVRGQGPAAYISEAGDPTAPQAEAYAIGVLALAAGLLLLAGAVVRAGSSVVAGSSAVAGSPGWPFRLAPALLVLAAAGAIASGTVQCSPGCPLPPYEQPTAADLVHAGASIAAVGLFGVALGTLALSPQPSWLRGSARVAFLLVAPLGLVTLALMLTTGRSPVTAGLERVMLAAGLGWMVLAGLLLAAGRTPGAPPVTDGA